MNSTILYVLTAIAIVVVNGKVGRKRESPPSPGKPSVHNICYQRENVCAVPFGTRYFSSPDQNENNEVIRSTPATVICSDLSELLSCWSDMYSEPPCDEFDKHRAQREAMNETVNHFCGTRLTDVEANKNCFASNQFFATVGLCASTHYFPNWRNCSQAALNQCIHAGIAQNSECGPAAPSLYDEAIVMLPTVTGAPICPNFNSRAKHFDVLKELLRWRFWSSRITIQLLDRTPVYCERWTTTVCACWGNRKGLEDYTSYKRTHTNTVLHINEQLEHRD